MCAKDLNEDKINNRMCTKVAETSSVLLTSASASINSLTISTWPLEHAVHKGPCSF